MLDAILAEERATSEDDGKTKQKVACNDCGAETLAPFHFVYHACESCRSYNTRVIEIVRTDGE
jgi:zinc finger-like protein